MKFTPRETIKSQGLVFEEGNTYNSELYGVADESVMRWHAAGWTDVEGAGEPGERTTRGVTMKPDTPSQRPRTTEG